MDHGALDDFMVRARMQYRASELEAATVVALEAFAAAHVDALLLKGPALAQRLYAQGERRGYQDVDLLVPPWDLASARLALTKLGYTTFHELSGIDDVGGVQHGEVWVGRGEQGGGVWIDLHWRLDGCNAAADVVWDALAGGRGSIELQGRQVAVPGDEGLALHLALHAAHHGLADRKPIVDLRRGIERWTLEVWRSAARLAETVQGVQAFAAGLRLIPPGAELASRLGLPPSPELEWEIVHREARPRGTFHLEAIADARGLRERASVLRRSLFPTRAWIETQFPWAARSRPLLLTAYARHIIRAPVWAARAARFRRERRAAGKH
jgi:Uncharacterised nucleotidyltransferase